MALEPQQHETEADLESTFRELGVDGLVVAAGTSLGDPLEDAIQRFRIPALWANEIRDHDCVVPDEAEGVTNVLEKFLQLGHRCVAYIDRGTNGHFSTRQRRDAFRAWSERARANAQHVDVTDDVHSSTAKLIHVLRQPGRPTACLVSTGETAQTLLWAAREVGLRVPEDLSIVALDDHHFRNVGLSITFKRIPLQEVGETAGRLIQDKIARPGEKLPPKLVPYGELKHGESLGPAPDPSGS